MIIDAHCHVWPDALAARLVAARPAGMDAVGDGTVSGLLRTMDAAGVDMSCVLGVANEAKHVARTNEFIGSLDRSRFIPFGTVHAGLSPEENVRVLNDHDIRAVKFHPNFQGLSLTEERMIDIFAALAESAVVVLAHVGEGADDAASDRGSPDKVRALLDEVPDLRLIACHYGGYHRLEAAEESVLGDPRVMVDTSWPPDSSVELGPARVLELITAHGAERVVFGSDWPMAHPSAEIDFIRGLDLPKQDVDGILGGNLARLLGITGE